MNHQPDSQPTATDAPHDSLILRGVAASEGVAIGPALRYARRNLATPTATSATSAGAPADEQRRAREALVHAAAALRALAEQVHSRAGAEQADIFEAQAMMLEDPTILDRVDELTMRSHLSAEAALAQAGEEQAQELASLPDPLWQGRAADVRDSIGRAVNTLAPPSARPQTLAEALAAATEPVIVLADDLAPSDTASAPPERLLGIALAQGGATSHAAILARALGIPAVVGLGPTLLTGVANGDLVALDGGAGRIVARPDEATQATTRAARVSAQASKAQESARLISWITRTGSTRDGVPIPIMANASSVAEARAAVEVGAEGIGLLRTEFLFASRYTLPSAEEQARMYGEIIAAFEPPRGPIVIRTLDAGADKPLASLSDFTSQLPSEENPALGVRGVRLQLRFGELLAQQMEGIALAAAQTETPIHIMLPMVTTVEEIELSRQALAAAQDRVGERGLEPRHIALGIMVETPAAALTAAALARHADFFSVGANDLAQYVMAADRLHPDLAPLRAPTQPALLRAIQQAAQAASARHIPIAVCGEMAGEPTLAALLVGLGVTELSMAPNHIPLVKEALASYRMADLRAAAERAVDAETVEAANRALANLTPLADGFSGA
ncbi:MAG TPA: phosphoenolpyruvate--protein phosphotransferase [Ktedonobacterales bacterium]|jgi:phosphoenolpyruvate-protein phosphotransferase|nr:phosphoenolpyruvate--protein phosphotransferase [Ktedonobacterales bacterium]